MKTLRTACSLVDKGGGGRGAFRFSVFNLLCITWLATAVKLSIWCKIQISLSDAVFLWKAVFVFYHLMTVTRSCLTTVLQQKRIRCHQKPSTTAGHILSSPLPRNLFMYWTGCRRLDVMLYTLLPTMLMQPTDEGFVIISVTHVSFFFFFSGKGG